MKSLILMLFIKVGINFIKLPAGQGMLASWQGTAFNVSYILGAVALMIVSVVMLKSKLFNKVTGWIGVLMGVLMMVPPTVGMFGIIISLLSLLPLIPWLILIAKKFFRLAHTA